jgi:alkylation response protein AidB-like acyl-CoA dehydrogenase
MMLTVLQGDRMTLMDSMTFEARNIELAECVDDVAPVLAAGAATHDREGKFVADHYATLKARRFFSAQIPTEMGGGGASHSEIGRVLQALGRSCSSTALALAMHQHLISTILWKVRHGGAPDTFLRKVAAEQLVLVSTGANDWLESNGKLEPVPGGYLLTATKPFASGSPAGDYAITSGAYDDPAKGARVLHFAVPLRQEGVRILSDWDTMGMRATGSNAIAFERVFIPESAISLDRPRGEFHPFFAVVCAMALPLVMSVYLGIAEEIHLLALAAVKAKKVDEIAFQLAGEMENELTRCRLAVQDMYRIANEGDFKPSTAIASTILTRKTIAAKAALATAEKAMELVCGRSYYRAMQIERLLRDLHAAQFHPLPEKAQQRFSGRLLLGLEPVG